MTDKSATQMIVRKPLVIMFEHEDKIICHLHPRKNDSHKGYGLIVCDLVRHVAKAFKVDEDDVWEWVDKERYHYTTDIQEPS
jgi:hypothetical protein